MRLFTDVISVVALNGTSSVNITQRLEPGEIESVVAIYKNLNNPSLVRVSIKTGSKEDILKLQAIENYRSREVEYSKDGIPIELQGGKDIFLTVISDEDFTADTPIDFIFKYKQTTC